MEWMRCYHTAFIPIFSNKRKKNSNQGSRVETMCQKSGIDENRRESLEQNMWRRVLKLYIKIEMSGCG